jgi:RHS repeat-associated protein
VDTTRSQSFTYDHLNRILTAETTSTYATSPAHCWGESYTYDQWGNLTAIGVASTSYDRCTQESLSVTALSNNQLSATGYSYDASGNMLTDGRNTYTWNSEDQLKTAAGVTYTYDGDGQRVEKSSGKLYWYGVGSDALMETDLSGNLTDEYIFFGGKRIARRDSSNNVVYYAADHLGTSRVVASSAGAILDQFDFYPFGGERVLSASSGNTYKFTSKERDTESNLDNFGARYDSSILGRFMSPDPKILSIRHIANPQKWNKYSYVLNNPLALFDPNGMEEVTIQFRAFIPQASVAGYKGDNRTFSSDTQASSRVTVTVRIETDPAKNHGNPLIGSSYVVGATHPVKGGEKTSDGPQLPMVTAGQDKNGNVTVNIKESMGNPYTKDVDPNGTIKANVNITVDEKATGAQFNGTLSGSPSFEANVSVDGGQNQNVPLQSAPDNVLLFILGLHQTDTINQSIPLKQHDALK